MVVLQSAFEQAKDEQVSIQSFILHDLHQTNCSFQISDYIRSSYKSATGSDFPIKDKPTTFG